MNHGYQKDDIRIVDYQLWSLPNSDLQLRGPAIDLTKPYIVALGAAQTFGRFVQAPYPSLLAEELGCQVLNLGISGAGPSFFLQRPGLIDVINKAKLAIVQVMSGRSTSNSRFTVAANQGLVRPVDAPPGSAPIFAETAYIRLIKTSTQEDLAALRAEIRVRAMSEMRALLDRITIPRVVLWFSKRRPDYAETLTDIGGYWGDFPHFLNEGHINGLTDYCDAIVNAVCAEGLPQPLHDIETGEPIELWGEAQFPTVKLRCHNHYYPSPEMHIAATEALREPIVALRNGKDSTRKTTRNNGRRDVFLHIHIFKNAGTSLDESLASSFGAAFLAADPASDIELWTGRSLIEILKDRPEISCVSSHQVRQPFFSDAGIVLYPYAMLRHPIDRLRSVYEFERREDRISDFTNAVSVWARTMELSDFLKKCLEYPNTRRIVSNFQTGVLGPALYQQLDSREQLNEIWSKPVNEGDFLSALSFVSNLPVVGVVERFEESLSALKNSYDLRFPQLAMRSVHLNQSAVLSSIESRVEKFRADIGEALYVELLQANAMDLALWQAANRKLDRALT